MNRNINIIVIFFASQLIAIANSNFSKERVKLAIHQYLESKITTDHLIEIKDEISDISFAEDGVRAQINGDFFKGEFSLSISFYNEENIIIKTQFVNIKTRLFKEVLVLKNMIAKSQPIQRDDLFRKKIEITNYDIVPISTYKEIIGKKLKANLGAGSPLFESSFQEENFVAKGDNVEVLAQVGNIIIRAQGTALQDGKKGEKIRVERDGAKKIIQCEIIERNKVVVR